MEKHIEPLFPQAYPACYVKRKIKEILSENKMQLDENIDLLEKCLIRMAEKQYTENDIAQMKQTVEKKITRLYEEFDNYQKQCTTNS